MDTPSADAVPPNLEPLPASRVMRWLATLDTGAFAAVMATGIVSGALQLLDQNLLAQILMWITGAMFVVLVVAYLARIVCYPRRVLEDLRAPSSAVSYFTIVAGCDVLALGLVGYGLWPVSLALGIAAFVVWLPLTYGLLCSIVLVGNHPKLHDITGIWLVWVVGTQSIAVIAAALSSVAALKWAHDILVVVSVAFWGVGVVLYFVLVVIIFLRLFLLETTPRELGPAYWILMGATAISVRAAAGLLAAGTGGATPWLVEMRPFMVGLSVVLWSFGSWFIPMLVLFGVWRYAVHGYSWRYEPKLWSVVFPLGMYTVASVTLGRTIGLDFLVDLGSVWVWIAVGAWTILAALFVLSIVFPERKPIDADTVA